MIVFDQLGKKGRLGNQFFQIAATLAHAKRMNTNACFNKWKYREYFEKGISDLYEFTTLAEDHTMPRYNEYQRNGYHKLPLSDSLLIEGYFQSEKYFADYSSYILSYFKPKHEFFRLVRDAGLQWLNLQDITAVHVRRTDYLNLEHLFTKLGVDHYWHAFNKIETLTNAEMNNGNFLFFSDDIAWCKQAFGTSRKYYYSTGNSDIVDLFLMAMCKHHIIANSSFSWWGSYLKRIFMTEDELKKSITIAPSTWFNPTSKLPDKDIFCEDWIRI